MLPIPRTVRPDPVTAPVPVTGDPVVMPAAASGRITPIGPTICIGRRGRSGDGARNSTKGAADQRPGAGRTRRRADQSAGSRSDQAAANRTLPRIIRIGAGRQRQNERER